MRTLFIAALLVLAWPIVALAQSLADRIPADAIVYVGWQGADSMPPGYQQSHLKGIIDASNLPQVFQDFLPKLMDKLSEEDPSMQEPMALLSEVGPSLWKHPSALYFGGVDFSNPQQPIPHLALLCDAGADAQKLADAVQKAVQQAGPMPFPVKVNKVGTVVYLVVGAMTAPGAGAGADAGVATLAKDAQFTAAMAQVAKEPVFAAYVDMERLLKLVDNTIAAEEAGHAMPPGAAPRPDQPSAMWARIREASGLAGVKRIAIGCGFDTKDWTSQAFIDAPAPRKGVVSTLLDGKPLSQDCLKLIPQNATSVLAGRMELAGLLDQVRILAGQLDPRAQAEMDQGIQQINQMLGLDLQKDLLGSLGSEWVCYAAPDVGGNGPLGMVIVNHLQNAAAGEKALDQLAAKANDLIAQEMQHADVKISILDTKIGDLKVHYLAVPAVAPAWTVKDGNLYIALYPQVLAAATDRPADAKSILDNPDYQALVKRLGGAAPSSIEFCDLPRVASEGYQMTLVITRLYLGLADMIGVQSPPLALPPLNKILPHLSPSGAQTWSDDKGWHLKTISPFPGAELMSGQFNMFGNAPMMAGLLGGQLMFARSAGSVQRNQMVCIMNLQQIGMACTSYSQEHQGELPADLGTIASKDHQNDAPTFICPKTRQVVPELKENEVAAWVNEKTSYIYLGNGMNLNQIKNPAQTILAYDKPENHRFQDVNVLFADGHVQNMTMPEFDKRMRPESPDKKAPEDSQDP